MATTEELLVKMLEWMEELDGKLDDLSLQQEDIIEKLDNLNLPSGDGFGIEN